MHIVYVVAKSQTYTEHTYNKKEKDRKEGVATKFCEAGKTEKDVGCLFK